MTDSAGEPHGRLAHLDRPSHLSPGTPNFRTKPESGVSDEIPADPRVDGVRALAFDKFNSELHAVRERRGDCTVEDGAGRQAAALNPETGEPGPPALKLVELLDPIPQPLRCQVEAEAMPVGNDRQRHIAQGIGGATRMAFWAKIPSTVACEGLPPVIRLTNPVCVPIVS